MLPSGPRVVLLSSVFLLLTGVAVAAGPPAPSLLPNTITLVAGGATSNPAQGAACASGSLLIATDSFGDGCLATQVKLGTGGTANSSSAYGPQFVAADGAGNVYLSDSANGLVRRVDAKTGIITAVAGGASSNPTTGATCGTHTSTDVLGDGCLATAVKVVRPEGIAFSPITGDLFFADNGNDTVRRVSMTTGVISTAAGNAPTSGSTTFGYNVNSSAGTVTAANNPSGYLNFPYGVAFDARGNLYIADEGNNAIEAVNMGTATTTILNVVVPAGTIAKVAGYGSLNTKNAAAGECPVFTAAATGSRGGCYFGKWTDGNPAVTSNIDGGYEVTIDAAGDLIFSNEFNSNVGEIKTDGTIYSVVGVQGAAKETSITTRGPATTTSIGSLYGATVDNLGNYYATDSTFSVIWRADAGSGALYVLAGGASSVCAGGDSVGNGCPALQAKFSTPILGSSGFASAGSVFGVVVDPAGNLLVADSLGAEIRKISTGAQFPLSGTALNATATQNVLVHFSSGDGPASSNAYSVASGFGDFTLGTASCAAANSDGTTDCVLPVNFKPSAVGLRTAPLLVNGTATGTTAIMLSGTGIGAAIGVDPGVQTTVASTGLTAVSSVAVDNAGNTYAAVPGASSVVKINSAGTASNLGTGVTGATSVAVDGAGNVFVAEAGGSVVEIPASGAAQTTVGPTFTKPTGIAVDQFGSLYVADQAANTVTRLVEGSYAPITLATSTAGLNGPSGLAVDAAGNVFVANTLGNNIVEITPNGTFSTAGSGLSAPLGVATDAAGSLYVADTDNGRIVFIPNESGVLTSADQIVVETGFTSPSGVAVAGTTLYVSDNTANSIVAIARGSATHSFGNDAIGTALTAPAAITSDGNVALAFSSPYYTATGNTTDFTLTPSTLSSGTSLATGAGVALTAGFNPTIAGSRGATYTFATTNATAPTLALSGTGINPVNATSTAIQVAPTSPTYGQTVNVTVTVSAGAGPTPTGTVTVNVDTTAFTPTLVNGVATVAVPGLSATSHTITASYPGDTNDSPSTATPASVTLAKAPLTIAINSVSTPYSAPLPTFTSTPTGVQNNDTIGVNYATTATQTSTIGTYPINGTATGAALANYNVTVTPGTLTVVKANTATTLAVSGTAVSSTTQVTLTATVSSLAPATGVGTGTVTFFNGSTAIGTPVAVNGSGVATTTTTFTAATNSITAVYSGDTNFTASTSPATSITVSLPTFTLTGISTTTPTVSAGQDGIVTFTITPAFGYNGTITFACTGIPATMGCTFAPPSITADGNNTTYLIGLAISSTQAGPIASGHAPKSGLLTASLAGMPLLALFAFFGLRRRPIPQMLRHGLVLLVGIGLMSAVGCDNTKMTTGTPKGTSTITVVATGTPGTGRAGSNVTSQFNLTVTVQ